MTRARPLPMLSLLGAALLALPGTGARAGEPPAGLEEMRDFARRLFVNEQYAEGINAYITIARQAPGDPRSHYDLAGAMVFLRMFPDAVPSIEKAISLDPGNTLYLEMAAMTYMQLQQYEKAFERTLSGARLGDVKAMYSVAGMYEHGRGTAASGPDALLWLERSARAGHMGAMDAMARVYRDGLYGQQPDSIQVRAWEQELERALGQ